MEEKDRRSGFTTEIKERGAGLPEVMAPYQLAYFVDQTLLELELCDQYQDRISTTYDIT